MTWLQKTKTKELMEMDAGGGEVEVDGDNVDWKVTLEGNFYCEGIEQLRAKLLKEFNQRFGVILGGNRIDLSPGSIVLRVWSKQVITADESAAHTGEGIDVCLSTERPNIHQDDHPASPFLVDSPTMRSRHSQIKTPTCLS
jgi:hypothetical protein